MNDITENQLFAFSHYSINGWFPASIEVIWGAILYQHKDAILKICKSPLLWGTGFMGINLVRCKIQFMQYQVDENKHVLYWYTLFDIVCTICIMFFAFSIMNYIKSTKYKNSICSLAGETFTIYLIHSCIIKMLNRFGIQSAIVEKLSKTGSGILFEVLYTGTMIFLVFLISFFLAKIINMCYKKLWKRI